MRCKVRMPNGKIEVKDIYVINPNALDKFASVGDTGESIQGTNLHRKLQ